MRNALFVFVCVGVMAALEGVFLLARSVSQARAMELKRRIGLLAGPDVALVGLLRKDRYADSAQLDAFLRGLPGTAKIERLLLQADARFSVAQWLGSSLGVSAGALFLLVLVGTPVIPSLVVALVALAAPTIYVLWARSRRSARISEQLPEALEMMSRSLRSGNALPDAFRLVASELPMPVSVEFARSFEEQAHGLAPDQAVWNMATRTPLNGDLRIFAVSVAVQKETGGNLAEILEKLSATIRDRYRFQSKVRALTAEGRMSGLVLALLPVAMMLLISMLRPEYAARLFDQVLGQVILGFAVVSWLAGVVWMNRMAKVEL